MRRSCALTHTYRFKESSRTRTSSKSQYQCITGSFIRFTTRIGSNRAVCNSRSVSSYNSHFAARLPGGCKIRSWSLQRCRLTPRSKSEILRTFMRTAGTRRDLDVCGSRRSVQDRQAARIHPLSCDRFNTSVEAVHFEFDMLQRLAICCTTRGQP